MPSVVITPPAFDPVTLDEAKTHLRVTHALEDSLIGALITVAREQAEHFTQRAICEQTREYTCPGFPGLGGLSCPHSEGSSSVNRRRIELPWPRVKTITSVKYTDTSDIEQTLASTEYETTIRDDSALLSEAFGKTWPCTRFKPDAVKVRYVTGWATAGEIPKSIKQALLLAIGFFYENREDAEATQLPLVSQYLLKPYQIMGF